MADQGTGPGNAGVLRRVAGWLVATFRKPRAARYAVYILVATAVVVPYIHALPLGFRAGPWSTKLYEEVDKLKPGSHVLVVFDYSPGSAAELSPMGLALLRHCHKKDLIPIVMTLWPDGVGLAKNICEQAAAESKKMWGSEKVAGRDYVFLGYRPGITNVVLTMGENIRNAFAQDYYGRSTQGMEALKGVDSLKDIDLAVDLAAGNTIDQVWIPYGADKFGFPLGAGCTAVMAPDMYPFLQSKQLVGYLAGLRGAADYEILLGKSGQATRGMQAQYLAHAVLIVLILGANVVYVVGRLRGGEGN